MLVFCSIGKGLRKVNLKDESIVEIVDFDVNLCSRVTSFNDILYYTDSNRSEAVCCDINGTILEVFSVNTTCFVKTMVNACIAVATLFQMTFRFLVVCSLEQMRLIRRASLYGILLVQCLG
jgi:hypothetical protein